MGLKVVGTRIVAQDAAKATADTKRFNDEVRKTGAAAREGSGGMGSWVGSIAKGVTIGNIATTAIMALGRAIKSVASEAVTALGNQEMLTQSLTSLVAKEIKSTDATMDMADALEQAGPRAEDLLKWIQQLAIESPFDQEGVAMAFRTSMAYGFTTAEAQRLTQATIDTSTALGAGTDVMNRVALALGQMRAKGKVSGEELRQLTEAGLATQPTLDALGYTLDDVSRGMVSADEFTQKFLETLESDFGGAAERSAGTLTGLLNSLGDIKTMGLVELFTPLKNELVPVLGQFTDMLQSRLLPVLTLVGQGLGAVTRWVIANKEAIIKGIAVTGAFVGGILLVVNAGTILTGVVTVLTGAVAALGAVIGFLLSPIGLVAAAVGGLAALFVLSFSDIKEKTGGFFQGMGKDLFSFGHGIIMALAEGMATAIGAVMDVLISIGNMIANWLSPGSPPKLLPDIDKWGMGAMQEYLKGFTMADFDVFGQASDTIEKYLRNIDIPENELVPRIAQSRTALSALVKEYRDTGQVGEESFQRLFKAIGTTNPAIQQYLRETIAVQAAQEKLNNITKKYDEILNPLTQELNDIQKERQKYIDDQRKAELESIVADANAPAEAKRLAMLELREMAIKDQIAATEEQKATEMDAAQTELDAATERMNAQRAMLDIQAENNSLLQEQLSLMEGLGEAIGGSLAKATGAAGGLKAALGGLGAEMPSVTAGIGDALGGLKERFQGFVSELAAPFAELGGKLETLKETWADAFIAMGQRAIILYTTFKQAVFIISFNILQLITYLQNAKTTWQGNIDLMKIAWNLFKEKVKEGVEAAKGFFADLAGWVQTQSDRVVGAINDAYDWVNNLWGAVKGFWEWLKGKVFEFTVNLPSLPDWALPGSPIPLHTAWKQFGDYMKAADFSPQMNFQPHTPPASAAQQSTTYNYNYQLQPVGNATINNGMDLAMLQNIIEQSVIGAMRS